jgi:dienelactone hydrolase
MELKYGQDGFKVGLGLRKLIPKKYSLMDVAAWVEHFRGGSSPDPKVAVVGYCWGGTLACLAA